MFWAAVSAFATSLGIFLLTLKRGRPPSPSVSSSSNPAPVPPVPVNNTSHGLLKRAIGFCTNEDCQDYGKGNFLMEYREVYLCDRCDRLGRLKIESGNFHNENHCVREVRVEFCYDFVEDRYTGLAVVWDASQSPEGTNTYEIHSPIIRTKKRALGVAESVLANLQRVRNPSNDCDNISANSETILNLDTNRTDFRRQCQELGIELSGNNERRRKLLRE